MTNRLLLTTASAVALSLALGGCNSGSSSSPPPVVSAPVAPLATGWTVAYSPTMPPQLPMGADGLPYFDFPGDAGIHYVIEPSSGLLPGQTITLQFSLVGDGVLAATEGAASPRVRLFLQRAGDDLSGIEPYQQYRYWSRSYVELTKPGDYVLSCQVQPDQWIDVYGKPGTDYPDAFAACVANLQSIGFTFGGQFAGHGVRVVSGSMRFVLVAFAIS